MRPVEASRPWRSLPAIRRLVAAIVVLLAAESTALAADPTMFEGARAMHALEAIAAQAGHKPRFLSLDITAEGLTAEIQDPADPSRVVTWRVSQPGMLRSLLGTTAVRGRSAGTDPACRQPRGKSVRLRSGGACATAAIGRGGAGPRAPAGAGCGRPDGAAPAAADPAHHGRRAAPVGNQG